MLIFQNGDDGHYQIFFFMLYFLGLGSNVLGSSGNLGANGFKTASKVLTPVRAMLNLTAHSTNFFQESHCENFHNDYAVMRS